MIVTSGKSQNTKRLKKVIKNVELELCRSKPAYWHSLMLFKYKYHTEPNFNPSLRVESEWNYGDCRLNLTPFPFFFFFFNYHLHTVGQNPVALIETFDSIFNDWVVISLFIWKKRKKKSKIRNLIFKRKWGERAVPTAGGCQCHLKRVAWSHEVSFFHQRSRE